MAQRNVTPTPSPGQPKDEPPGAALGRLIEESGVPQYVAQSASGTLVVKTTARGLPTAIKIDKSELKKPPQQLAADILALCKLAAMRLQVAKRRELVEQGKSITVIRALRLATEEELASAEEEFLGDEDIELPATWMRSV